VTGNELIEAEHDDSRFVRLFPVVSQDLGFPGFRNIRRQIGPESLLFSTPLIRSDGCGHINYFRRR
jgi:hypothetical protein